MSTEAGRTNLANFTIVLANEEQQVQHCKAGFPHWRKDRKYEEYHDIYLRERAAIWGKNGKLLTWALVKRDDPQGEIYAGCETYTRTGFVKHKGSDEVESTHLYAIASVVTPEQHLRNGYATRLLSLLHHRLATGAFPAPPESWGTLTALPDSQNSVLPKGIGSILWSDVGSSFYSRCAPSPDRQGWVVDESKNQELVWDLHAPSSSTSTSNDVESQEDLKSKLEDGWEWIYPSSLSEVGARLSRAAKEKLQTVDSTEKAVFIFDPASEGTLNFVPEKGNWSRDTPFDHEPVGLRTTAKDGKETVVLFSVGVKNIGPTLLVTYVHNLHPEQLPSLLRGLDLAGSITGQKEGWVWDLSPSSPLVKAWEEQGDRNVKVARRAEEDGHLLGVAWYGPKEEEWELVDGQMWLWC